MYWKVRKALAYFISWFGIKQGDQGTYSKHFIFFVTYESAQQARVLHNTRLERLANEKHSNFISPIHKVGRKISVVNTVPDLAFLGNWVTFESSL